MEKLKPKFELEILEDFRKYFKRLNFSLELEKLEDLEEFNGLLKLPKDPKPEEINLDNIIEKDAIICT